MLRAADFSRLLRTIIKDKGIKQEALAAVIGKDRRTLNKKLHGKVPWYYEEVVAISVFLEMPGLAYTDAPAPKATDPEAKALLRRLQRLPAADRKKFYRLVQFVLEGKGKQPNLAGESSWRSAQS